MSGLKVTFFSYTLNNKMGYKAKPLLRKRLLSNRGCQIMIKFRVGSI